MKKIPSRARRGVCRTLLMLLSLLFLLTGCGKELYYLDPVPTAAADTAVAESVSAGWQPIPDYDPDAVRGQLIESATPYVPYFVETKYCIVFVDIRDNVRVKYINKANGTVHLLCGDPLCNHVSCPAALIFDENNNINNTEAARKSLTYVPETGRLYWARKMGKRNTSNGYTELLSIDIDHMDFTIQCHYRSKPGDGFTILRYDGGKLYFNLRVREEGEEYPTALELHALSLADDSVETVGVLPFGIKWIVRDGVVYYQDGFGYLYSYTIADGTAKTLWEGDPESHYIYYNGHILCYSEMLSTIREKNVYLIELDLDGNVVREYDLKDADERHRYSWVVGPAGEFYSLGYDPHLLNYYGTGEVEITFGRKILRWVDGEPELYFELDDPNVTIEGIVPIGNALFINAQNFNARGVSLSKPYPFCIVDGKIFKIPE